MAELLGLMVAISTWAAPQPAHSAGLIVVYGNQKLIEANAAFRGYTLDSLPGRCGLSAISPAMLGQLAWVRVPGGEWQGPCVVVDAVARSAAYDSIYRRHEIAEVSRDTAAALGFTNGGIYGYVFFGACPPADGPQFQRQSWADYARPRAYAPPLVVDAPPYEAHKSFYPYAPQQRVMDC